MPVIAWNKSILLGSRCFREEGGEPARGSTKAKVARRAGVELRTKGAELSIRSFGERGLLRKVHFLEILENSETLENPQTVEDKGESEHFLENSETVEIQEISPLKRPLL